MGFGGFLKALSQSGFTSHFRSGWYLGFSPSELLLASPCFRQNPKYQPRYYDRFRERLQETPKPHGSRTYWELTIFSRLTGFTGDTEDWSFFPCSIAPLEIRKPLSKSASVHGFKGQGFKPALVRRDVAMKLLSHSMGLAFHHHILTCQVWARGSIVIPGPHLGRVFTRKTSGLVMPNPKFRAKLAITWENEHF